MSLLTALRPGARPVGGFCRFVCAPGGAGSRQRLWRSRSRPSFLLPPVRWTPRLVPYLWQDRFQNSGFVKVARYFFANTLI